MALVTAGSLMQRWVRIGIGLLFISLFTSRSGIVAASAWILIAGTVVYRREFWHRVRQIPQLVPLAVFLGCVLISIVFADPYPWQHPLAKLRYWLLYFPLLFAFVAQPTQIRMLAQLGWMLAVVVGSVALIQHFGGWYSLSPWIPKANYILHYQTRFHARGFLPHHTIFSSVGLFLFHFMLGALLAHLRNGLPIARYAIGCLFSAAAIFATFSRGAWLALLISAIASIALFLGRRSIPWIAASVAGVLILLAVSSPFRNRFTELRASQNSERLALWKVSYQMFRESPWIGKGFHSFASHLERLMPEHERKKYPMLPQDAHSIYFDLLGGTGLLGLVSFLVLSISVLLSYLRLSHAALNTEDRIAVITGFGTFVAALANNLTDTHLIATFGLCGSVFFLALGQSVVMRNAASPIGSIQAIVTRSSRRSAKAQ